MKIQKRGLNEERVKNRGIDGDIAEVRNNKRGGIRDR